MGWNVRNFAVGDLSTTLKHHHQFIQCSVRCSSTFSARLPTSRSSICDGVNGCGGCRRKSGLWCLASHKKRHLSILLWKLSEQNMLGGTVEVNKDGCKFGDRPHKLEYRCIQFELHISGNYYGRLSG